MNQPPRQVTVPRYLLHLRSEPVPHPERMMASFKAWLAQQDQLRHPRESGDPVPFNRRGGLGKAHQLFGPELPKVIEALNRECAA